MINLTTQVEKLRSNLMWNYILRIPHEAVNELVENDFRRVVCQVDDGQPFHAALFHDGGGDYFITLNKARRSKMGLIDGQVVKVKLEKDNSPYGISISSELLEVLDQDEEGSAIFHDLTPGKQRTLIHWVDTVKSSEIKIRRALVLMKHLHESNGNLDFKRLGFLIKEANQASKRA